MECSLLECSNPITNNTTCEICFIPKYCSENCKTKDSDFHFQSCRPHIFTLKDFTITKDIKIIGTGTYNEIQLVQNIDSNKFYVMKTYKKSTVCSIIPLKILFREISIHKSLNHPNIIRLYDHIEDTIKIYIILEYTEKGSLFNIIRKKIKLSESEIWPIFTQICIGLNYLHTKNLIHRNLKPENLLINKDDIVKICDFGWATRDTESRNTFCGTLDYMSPEMVNNYPQSYKVDIWALGVLLYEMLHGTTPYRAKNLREMARMINYGVYNIGTHVSNTAKTLISLLLQENPENRPPIIEILKTQWVQEFCDHKIKPGWKVKHINYGEGIVKDCIGLVCNVGFMDKDIEIIENDLIRVCSVFDENGEIIYENSLSVHVKSDLDLNKNNSKVSPLYKKLGIDENRPNTKIYIKPAIKSAKNSRTNSGNNSGNNSPTVRFEPGICFEPARKDPRLPRSPKGFEEAKRSQQLPIRKIMKHDFEGINLSPEPVPGYAQRRFGTPKSSFLQKFKKPATD
ncbi:hypothetical protein SteCoe_25570 [Stentor coeruleus]|uniref:Protein kinase domain-containing protein n=1 Tax=Stentor coeruleus TaxID=5963 RepID=A0A1R2BET8_9CILI|nr:hypothetical protein SteCoe_25570 [Stentor coeruleus]